MSQDDLIFNQIKQTDDSLEKVFEGVKVRHLFDRGHDDQALFEFVDDLSSSFIVRAKSNRNANEFITDEKAKTQAIKLIHATLEQTQERVLEKFIWKNKVFQQAKMSLTWGKLTLQDRTYSLVRIQVFDCHDKTIFKDKILLIINELVANFDIHSMRKNILSIMLFIGATLLLFSCTEEKVATPIAEVTPAKAPTGTLLTIKGSNLKNIQKVILLDKYYNKLKMRGLR